jgi:septal ring factor EnvC (AmiA/AmiB activator)
MIRSQIIVFIVFSSVTSAYASAFSPSPQQPAQAAAVTLQKVEKRVERHRSEVQRLQQDVAAQEAHSEHATERLQQQDQAISALRKQLEALQSTQAAGQR